MTLKMVTNNYRSGPHSPSKSNLVIIMRRDKRERKKKKIDFEGISKLRL
jgi:hypothetical protein